MAHASMSPCSMKRWVSREGKVVALAKKNLSEKLQDDSYFLQWIRTANLLSSAKKQVAERQLGAYVGYVQSDTHDGYNVLFGESRRRLE